MSIKVTNEVRIYEVNDEREPLNRPVLIVKSHWNRNEFVVLEFEGKCITVARSELSAAMANATNVAR